MGRVMVSQGLPAFIRILPWLEKREPDALPVPESAQEAGEGRLCLRCLRDHRGHIKGRRIPEMRSYLGI